jgi:hypothetical protein
MTVLLTRKRVMAAKAEATPGTPETLSGTDGAENFFEPSFTGNIPSYKRQGQGTFSAIVAVPGARSAQIKFRTEVYNSGATTLPFWARVLLPIAGLSATGGAYTPLTGNQSTATIGHYVNGNLYEIAGAMANLKIMGDKTGEPVKAEWDATGLYIAPTATAMVTPTYPKPTIPRFAGATLSLGAISMVVSKFELDLGNTVTLREDASNVSGYAGTIITDRKPTIKLTVEVPPIGTHDYYNDYLTSVEAAFSLALGSGTNGIVTIAAPKLQLDADPKHVDLNGVFGYELTYQLNRSAAAGDDEFSVTFS